MEARVSASRLRKDDSAFFPAVNTVLSLSAAVQEVNRRGPNNKFAVLRLKAVDPQPRGC